MMLVFLSVLASFLHAERPFYGKRIHKDLYHLIKLELLFRLDHSVQTFARFTLEFLVIISTL